MSRSLITIILFLTGCYAGGGYDGAYRVAEKPKSEQHVAPVAQEPTEMFNCADIDPPADPPLPPPMVAALVNGLTYPEQGYPWPALKLTPDAELMEAAQVTAARLKERVGLDVEFTNDGIPMMIVDEIVWKGSLVDGLAHYDSACSFADCNEGHGVYILISEETALGDKQWGKQQTVDHEVGHVVTGWGVPSGRPQHLTYGNLMGPGCVNHVCPEWTLDDAMFMCGAAPCRKIEL